MSEAGADPMTERWARIVKRPPPEPLEIEVGDSPTVSEPRTEAGKRLLSELYVVDDNQLRRGILAIEAEAAQPIDVEWLARAIQSTILTTPDEYMTEMGSYRKAWVDLTLDERRRVLSDARALRDEYARLRASDTETGEEDER